MVVPAQHVSELIGSIYDSIFDSAKWQKTLSHLCDAIDAKAASIHVIDPVQGKASLYIEHGTDPNWTALLMSKYAGMSPIGSAVLLADVEEPISAFDFIDEAEFTASRFYREWCAPQGYHDMMGVLLAKRPQEVAAVSATRHIEKGRFGEIDRELFKLLAPHFRRAVDISGLLEHRSLNDMPFERIVETLGTAVVIVDQARAIKYANPPGLTMLRRSDLLSDRNGRLALVDGAADRRFADFVTSPTAQPVIVDVASASGAKKAIAAVSLPSGDVALLVNDLASNGPAAGKYLKQIFGFTPREITVLMPLMQGQTMEEAAETLGISIATARSHLQRLYAKTGSSRQHDLVRKVMEAMPPNHSPTE